MSNTTKYRLQLQHMAYERNRQERKRQESMPNLGLGGGGLGHDPATAENDDKDNDVNVKIHRISNHDEGVLYTHMITVGDFFLLPLHGFFVAIGVHF
jgi:hypothetical protein